MNFLLIPHCEPTVTRLQGLDETINVDRVTVMQNATTSTIAQLFFVRPPVLNFARLVADLNDGLRDCPVRDRSLTWDHDDIAIFDLEGSRITVSYVEDLDGPHTACLSLSVGFAEDADPSSPIGKRQSAIARVMVDRITARFPPDDVQWIETEAVVTSDIIDGLIELVHGKPPTPDPRDNAVTPLPDRIAPVDYDRIMGEFEGRLQMQRQLSEAKNNTHRASRPTWGRLARYRRRARATPVVAPWQAGIDIANTLPDLPRPDLSEAQMIRMALYNSPTGVTGPSTELRLATHAMNATMMVFALPIGASMMTYSILRGENLHASARMLAIIGTLAGLQYSPFGVQILTMI